MFPKFEVCNTTRSTIAEVPFLGTVGVLIVVGILTTLQCQITLFLYDHRGYIFCYIPYLDIVQYVIHLSREHH